MEIKNLINQLLINAYDQRIADIYILPFENQYLVKHHGHHQLLLINHLTKEQGLQVISYFKYHGNMLISDHRRPQLGAMKWSLNERNCYLRFSTVGDFKGRETLVIRLIYPLVDQKISFFDPIQYDDLKQLTNQRGLIVFAGPTGSGKTTTIYQLAREYSKQQMVMSIEDPVEIYEPSFLQLQVNEDAAMSYQELLKVGLRNRPDIFIVGEIRDEYTAKAAIRAALSGHLVLTTLHAKHPLGVIERLTDLGIGMEYLKQSLTAVVYQRLILNQNQMIQSLMNTVTAEQIFVEQISQTTILSNWQSKLRTLAANSIINEAEKRRVWYG
ncbi:competence type IV pilus ATPase ComGA [Lactobacillaceae bacterium Scapto_B20]